jgi:RNA-binding protein YlmH
MNTMQVLEASTLFTSRSDVHKHVKNKAVKLNGQPVEDVNEEIELGDFLNFTWFPHAVELMREHGRVFIIVGKGKKDRVLLKIVGDQITVFSDMMGWSDTN